MSYKLVIFDLDGTILNTLNDLCEASNFALKTYGLPSITLKETQAFIGNGIRNLLQQASKNSSFIDEILGTFKEYYTCHYNDFTEKYAGIDQVIKYCIDNGIHMGVLTNKVEDIAKKLVEEHFPNQMEFIYGEMIGRPKKPDISFLLSIIKKYGLSLDEVLYVGDSEVDVKLCNNAHIDGVFASYGFRGKEELLKITHQIIDTPLELLNYLGEE